MAGIEIIRRTYGQPPTQKEIQSWLDRPPRLVLVDFGKECNLWCDLHCGYPGQQIRREEKQTKNQEAEPVFIDVDILKAAYQEIATTWEPYKPVLQISADGEPLLHPRREEAICYPAKELGLNVGLTTNGTLLTPLLVEKFCLANVNLINVSLDAATEQTYGLVRPERHRRVNYFNRVLENIRKAVEIRNEIKHEYNTSTQFMITMILRPESADEEEAFLELGKQLGVDRVSYRPLNTSAGLTPFPGKDISDYVTLDKGGVVTHVEGISRYPCHFPFTRFSLSVAKPGSVKLIFCPHAWDRDTADIGLYPHDGSLRSLWESAKLQDVRKAHLSGKFTPGTICAGCPDWRFVTGKDQVFFSDIIKKQALGKTH